MKRQILQVQIVIIFILCSSFLMLSSAYSSDNDHRVQTVEIPSSPNPVGSGARALGLGGAFIAVADDATAASWNPGGLIQLDYPEVSFVYNGFHRIEDNDLGVSPVSSGDQTVSKIGINYLSAAYPFNFKGYNMIFSLNYQHLYGFNRKWNFPLISDSQGISTNHNIDYKQEGSLSALGVAYCVRVNTYFSVGLTLNIWEDWLGKNEWEAERYQSGTGIYEGEAYGLKSSSFDRYSFSGINANFGFIWNINKKISIGGVFKMPFEADLRHERRFKGQIFELTPEYDYTESVAYIENETMDMPMSYGIGLGYKFSEKLRVAFDIYRTEWDDFILTDFEGQQTSPFTGLSVGESDISPTHQVRMGAEYLFKNSSKYVFPIRGGVFYDPAPAKGSPDDIFGLSIGGGIVMEETEKKLFGATGFSFDIAYQYRFGNNVGDSTLKKWDFSQDLDEHTVYSSVIIYF
ncbi:MAG: hypothetical protein GY795_51725 [Desulfobacterales bacterium]|nr:hypothetical protein [Desulfobacterales bacterium]